MEQSEQLAFPMELTTGTPYRDAVQGSTIVENVDRNEERGEAISNANLPHTQHFTHFADFAPSTPYRCSDLNYFQQLVHLAFGQLPDFQRIDVPIFLQLCIQTKARLLPRATALLWHHIFSVYNQYRVSEYLNTQPTLIKNTDPQ